MTAFEEAWQVVKYCGREKEDPWHPNSPPPIPVPGLVPHEIPPLRQLQDESQRFTRKTAGAKPPNIKRHEGGTSASNRKGDSRDEKTSTEKLIDARLNRLGIGGERGV